MAARPGPAHQPFTHTRTVRLIAEDNMVIDALSLAQSLPDFKDQIVGVVPLFGGKCFDITLKTTESATQLAATGFDYESRTLPLRLLGKKALHVSCFMPIEYPDNTLLDILAQYGPLKQRTVRRLYFKVPGYEHIENGIRVVEFEKLDKALPRKLVTQGLEIFFKYTGQPVLCYRCQSSEHVVKDCPKARRATRNVDTETGGTQNPPPDPQPVAAENTVQAPAATQATEESTDTLPTRASQTEPSGSQSTQEAPLTAASMETEASPPANSEESTPPSYAAVTQELYTASQSETNKRKAPQSPTKDASTAKKQIFDRGASLKEFMEAMGQDGPARAALLNKLPANPYYRSRGLFLQHKYGDITKNKIKDLDLHDDEKREWKAFKGCIRQDAYARLLLDFEKYLDQYKLFP